MIYHPKFSWVPHLISSYLILTNLVLDLFVPGRFSQFLQVHHLISFPTHPTTAALNLHNNNLQKKFYINFFLLSNYSLNKNTSILSGGGYTILQILLRICLSHVVLTCHEVLTHLSSLVLSWGPDSLILSWHVMKPWLIRSVFSYHEDPTLSSCLDLSWSLDSSIQSCPVMRTWLSHLVLTCHEVLAHLYSLVLSWGPDSLILYWLSRSLDSSIQSCPVMRT